MTDTDREAFRKYLRLLHQGHSHSEAERILGAPPSKSRGRYTRREDYFVYFIFEKATGLTKIGRSIDPHKRVAALERDRGASLVVYHTISLPPADACWLERALHDTLKEHCVGGEWFKLPKSLLTAIRKIHRGNLHFLIRFLEDRGLSTTLAGFT